MSKRKLDYAKISYNEIMDSKKYSAAEFLEWRGFHKKRYPLRSESDFKSLAKQIRGQCVDITGLSLDEYCRVMEIQGKLPPSPVFAKIIEKYEKGDTSGSVVKDGYLIPD